ncbi:MAG: BBE domain-containing protein [Dermatophilaceae bacterium]
MRDHAALAPAANGVCTTFLNDEGHTDVASAYGSRLARLTALKDRDDPTNVFRHNANAVPSASAG